MRYTPREKIGLRDPSDDLREKETLSECVGMLLGKPKSIWNGIWQGTGTETKRAFTGSWVAKWKMSAHWKGQDSWCWRIWKHLRYQWLLCFSLYWENPPSGIWGVRHQKSMDPPRLGWGGSGKGIFKQTRHTQSMGPDGMLPQAQRELASVTERPLWSSWKNGGDQERNLRTGRKQMSSLSSRRVRRRIQKSTGQLASPWSLER